MNHGFLTYLRLLLAQNLPLDLLRPELQVAAKEALSFDDPNRLHGVALQVVAELVRQGELVPALQEKRAQKEFLWLVRTTSCLLDLTLLFSQDPMGTETELQYDMQEDTLHSKRTPQLDQNDFDRALRIIEGTQIGEVYEPEGGLREVILDKILTLLNSHLPGLHIFIYLFPEKTAQSKTPLVFFAEEDQNKPLWLQTHTKMADYRICSRLDLPDPINLALFKRELNQEAPVSETDTQLKNCMAISLFEPQEAEAEGQEKRQEPQEVGLVFVISQNTFKFEEIKKTGDRLSQHITKCWAFQRELNKKILYDHLTGLANRRHFDMQFDRELERAKRQESEFVLILADIDKFKAINTSIGYEAANTALKLVADTLGSGIRKTDYVFRYGGEEFIIILPDTNITKGREEVLERLLHLTSSLTVPNPKSGQPLNVSLSYGAACFPWSGTDYKELFRKINDMLDLAKNTGRNRAYFENPDGEPWLLLPPPAGD